MRKNCPHLSTKQQPRFMMVKPERDNETCEHYAGEAREKAERTDHGRDVSLLSSVQLADRRKDEGAAPEPDDIERDCKRSELTTSAVAGLQSREGGDKDRGVQGTLGQTGGTLISPRSQRLKGRPLSPRSPSRR